MNIKSLFIYLMLLAGFASCSSDSKDELGIPENEASLTIQLSPQGVRTTRAAEPVTTWDSELNIHSYIILICDANDRIQNRLTGTKNEQVVVNKYQTGVQLRIYAFVNLTDEQQKQIPAVGNVLNLKELTVKLGDQKVDGLTMGCTEATVLTLRTTNNTAVIPIVRYVSRIQISSIKTDFKVANDYSVEINNLALTHVKEQSYLYNTTNEVADGMAPESYPMLVGWESYEGLVLSNKKPLIFSQDIDEVAEGQYVVPYRYVFENTEAENPTQLVLRATLKDAQGTVVATRDFNVTINAKEDVGKYVRRNYIYDLGLTFTDTSFDMAALVVKITVIPWGNVKQEPDID